MALISVIVPVYNVEEYLDKAVQSLLLQEGCELEIILVDDGSTDSSGTIADSYAQKYENIVCIHQENRGLSAARNNGLDHSHGEYIMFLDSDDYFERNRIHSLEMSMITKKLDILLFSGEKVYEGSTRRIHFGPQLFFDVMDGYSAYEKLRNTKNYFTCVVFMILRRAFLIEKQIRFVEGVLHEDHDFAFRVITEAKRIACVTDVIYYYRIRNNSIMTGKAKYGKRFAGFEVCIADQIELYRKSDKRKKTFRECLKKHIKELSFIAIKYYLKMGHEDYLEWNEEVARLNENLKELRGYQMLLWRLVYQFKMMVQRKKEK